jgi:hypothetical protein
MIREELAKVKSEIFFDQLQRTKREIKTIPVINSAIIPKVNAKSGKPLDSI